MDANCDGRVGDVSGFGRAVGGGEFGSSFFMISPFFPLEARSLFARSSERICGVLGLFVRLAFSPKEPSAAGSPRANSGAGGEHFGLCGLTRFTSLCSFSAFANP